MKPLLAFFKLIRWPNLVFIALTQILFHYTIVVPSAYGKFFSFPLYVKSSYFWVLCISTIFIAAAGYIINDYFDVNIDQVNKPKRNVIDRGINRRWALLAHMLLSLVGIGMGAWVSYAIGNPIIVIAHIACVALLWFYSTTFKRQMLVGNIVISALTAWVIMVQLVAELPGWWNGTIQSEIEKITITRLSRIGMLYAGFAFVISLIREVVKDIEDVEGDRKNGCRTMPIVMGKPASKMFVSVWVFILVTLLIIAQVYAFLLGWWWSVAYVLVLVVAPLIQLIFQVQKANTVPDFAALSKRVKLIMFTGILSMAFFLLYTN